MCSFGTAPSNIIVLPTCKVMIGTPVATIMDNVSMVNIMPFAMCRSPTNPSVDKMTGIGPCVPLIVSPWMPGVVSCLIGGTPALDSGSRLMCNWGGVIQILSPGQTKTLINK
jgi:hypothetical protein